MQRWIYIPGFILAVAGAIGVWYSSQSAKTVTKAVRESHLLKQADGPSILAHVKSLNSPIVLINFWASWCVPCKAEFPAILQVRDKLQAKGFKVVFISIDDTRDFEAAERFLNEHKVSELGFYKGTQNMEFVMQVYPKWSGAVPASLIIGPDMQILEAWEGEASAAEFESRVMKHLKGS